MYLFLKKIIHKIFPPGIRERIDPFLRQVYSLMYWGKKVYCPLCERHFSHFISIENKRDLLCPACGSLPRYRMLYLIMNKKNNITNSPQTLLHFSPARSLKRKLKSFNHLKYITTDYVKNKEDRSYDITAIEEQDNSYDIIICLHVLEHIINDMQAMKELYRILKPGATAYIQTPFKQGSIYEDYSIESSNDRLKHFGQEDHVRVYSIAGLKQRLEQTGFKTKLINSTEEFNTASQQKYGIIPDDTMILCTK